MSPRAKKKTDAEASGEAVTAEAAEAPKKRGRPRKNPAAEAVTPADPAPAPAAAAEAERAPEAPVGNGRRGRRPRAAAADDRGAVASQADDAAPATSPRQGDAGEERARSDRSREERDARGDGRRDEGQRGRRDRYEVARDDVQDDRDDDRDGDGDRDGEGDRDGGSDGELSGEGRESRDRQSQRSRRNRGGQRKAGLNFRDLQGKIVPELHLLAKEVGLEQFREMPKETLVQSILERSTEAEGLRLVRGYLEISSDGYGFLQESLLQNNTRSVIVSAGLIKQFRLRTGDAIMGKARRPRDNERYGTLIRVEAVNGVDPFQASKRPRFDDLVPTFPDTRIQLEMPGGELSARVIDLLAPIGRGQRGLIVAPPKAGKTTLLKAIAKSVVNNEPDIKVIVLLVDERPEEVTDFRESVQGVEVVASTFDEPPANHIRVAEFVHERARRIVEDGGHIMILLDSITRLARANNLVTPATGRTLSGGLDSNALHWPKRFLGAARNIRGGGSLSILATALVETGSRMDDVIFEEFKGTGNMELHLSRRLEERRIFPAIDILKSGTRREDLLLSEDVLAKMWLLRKVISDMDASEAMEMLLSRLSRTKGNAEFMSTLGHG
jgi:transcription termination factor Rho